MTFVALGKTHQVRFVRLDMDSAFRLTAHCGGTQVVAVLDLASSACMINCVECERMARAAAAVPR